MGNRSRNNNNAGNMVEIGTVKWFHAPKGYGFLIPDSGGNDLFVHHTDILMDGYRELHEDERVEFRRAPGRNGKEKAVLVRKLS